MSTSHLDARVGPDGVDDLPMGLGLVGEHHPSAISSRSRCSYFSDPKARPRTPLVWGDLRRV